jgi:ribonuclease HII
MMKGKYIGNRNREIGRQVSGTKTRRPDSRLPGSLIGIDEVGRGPLAGPVVVAAVAASINQKSKIKNQKSRLRDSKKLTEKQREEWFRWIKRQTTKGKLQIATASVYPKTIDRINISQAANLAASRALRRLMINNTRLTTKKIRVILDGGLYVRVNPRLDLRLSARTIVRGDEKFNCIKLASIIAKVRRDRLMKRYHKKFPQYGFNEHKGYGTKKHITAIKKYGICELHRISFLGNFKA